MAVMVAKAEMGIMLQVMGKFYPERYATSNLFLQVLVVMAATVVPQAKMEKEQQKI